MRPLLVLIIAVPLTFLAIVRSTDWFSAPFPSFLLMENAVVFPEYEGVVKFPVDGNKGLTWADAKEGAAAI